VILSGGETIYSTEVENVLYAHPAVVEAAVFGRPDELWGEAVCAAVVTSSEVTSDQLRAHCREHLAGFKLPRHIAFLESLPRTGSGKIAKRMLRDN
jgi:acyl-CoA synthetase (AMP-forming)/AMP-acid ligase II